MTTEPLQGLLHRIKKTGLLAGLYISVCAFGASLAIDPIIQSYTLSSLTRMVFRTTSVRLRASFGWKKDDSGIIL